MNGGADGRVVSIIPAMGWLKRHWQKGVGAASALVLLWQFGIWLGKAIYFGVRAGGDVDFIVSRVREPGWVRAMIEFFLNPPPWLILPAFGVLAVIFFWRGSANRPKAAHVPVSDETVGRFQTEAVASLAGIAHAIHEQAIHEGCYRNDHMAQLRGSENAVWLLGTVKAARAEFCTAVHEYVTNRQANTLYNQEALKRERERMDRAYDALEKALREARY